MQRRHASRITPSLVALLTSLLIAGVAAVAVPAPADAAPRPGATGLHDGMMPADSPDAVPAGGARPTTGQPNANAGATPQAAAGAQTGVDVSRWQHPNGASIDWNQVRASGQAFAIVKATELYTDTSTGSPVLYTNPYFSGDVAAARAAGLVVGAYAFAHPENSATAQADDFAKAIGGSLGAGSLPPVLDLEVNGGLSPAQLVSWTQTFLDRLQADTGTVPMIYTGPSFWQTSMGGNTGFGRYPLWEAHYTTAAAPAAIPGWSSYSLWQFTDSGSVAGITGNVDVSRSNGPVSSLTGGQGRADISPVGVAAVRTTPGSVLAFVRGTDGAVWVATAINGVFGAFQRIPSEALSGPAAVTANGTRVDVFVEGTDRALWHMALTVDSAGQPGRFEPWDRLGGVITSAPTAASSTSGRLLVSARGADDAVWSMTWNAGWTPWVSDGGTVISATAADVVDGNTYRSQVVGADGAVWTTQFSAATGAPLIPWQPTGIPSSVAPGASATAWWATSVRASGYGVGTAVQQRWADGRLVNLGGVITSGLALAEMGTTSVWTLARGTDDALWLNVCNGTTSTWSKVGGALA